MESILITQCLQNDFVKPLANNEVLPNLLHIGHEESERLIGDNLEEGPIGRFMAWAKAQPNEKFSTIHIRDWHDPNCPEQAPHLKQFNKHCIQNTDGAKFIFDVEESNPTIINSTTLNDFEGTKLKTHLDKLTENRKNKVRIGLIGVWTEAKILFLTYELSTRYPRIEIAVCSALCASSSRSQHFLALQQLDRIVGVTIIDSIGEFAQFLGGEYIATKHRNLNESLEINADSDINLDEESNELIRYLFRDCQRIDLKVLDGGFSGNLVAGVKSTDMHGHTQTPHVIKIGPRDLMAKERTAFEQIETVLGNNAPAIAEYADGQTRGAIKYRYASMGSGSPRSLQDCFQKGEDLNKLTHYLDIIFDQQLGRLYRAAVKEKIDLLEYYCFSSQWANSVKSKIEELIGECPNTGEMTLPLNVKAPNLYQFYKTTLDTLPPMIGDYPVAFVHGDLNGANVIIDEQENVWLIDFFHTHRGHLLKDFAKLENDLLYIYTPVDDDKDLRLAYEFSDFLLVHDDPFDLTENLPREFQNTQFERCYAALRHIRAIAKRTIGEQENLDTQWLIPLLRYAVHTIGFDEPNERQRVWALYMASHISPKMTNS